MMQLALTFNDIFKSSFLEQIDSFAPLDMVIALALAFALGLFILLIYRKTFSGVMYSASFGLSLMALTLITTLVINARQTIISTLSSAKENCFLSLTSR